MTMSSLTPKQQQQQLLLFSLELRRKKNAHCCVSLEISKPSFSFSLISSPQNSFKELRNSPPPLRSCPGPPGSIVQPLPPEILLPLPPSTISVGCHFQQFPPAAAAAAAAAAAIRAQKRKLPPPPFPSQHGIVDVPRQPAVLSRTHGTDRKW